jgi:hypothetical protein
MTFRGRVLNENWISQGSIIRSRIEVREHHFGKAEARKVLDPHRV